ncbi:hypothetical protein STEG23_027077, partial [Scotinomys teguina]
MPVTWGATDNMDPASFPSETEGMESDEAFAGIFYSVLVQTPKRQLKTSSHCPKLLSPWISEQLNFIPKQQQLSDGKQIISSIHKDSGLERWIRWFQDSRKGSSQPVGGRLE